MSEKNQELPTENPFELTLLETVPVDERMRYERYNVKEKTSGKEYQRKIFKRGIGAAKVLPMDNEENIYFVYEFMFGIQKWTYNLPGGKIDEGETVLETAARELKEESGIVAKNFIHLGYVHPESAYLVQKNNFVLATDLTFEEQEFDGQEVISEQIIKVPFDKALEMVASNEIIISEVSEILLRAKLYLDKQINQK